MYVIILLSIESQKNVVSSSSRHLSLSVRYILLLYLLLRQTIDVASCKIVHTANQLTITLNSFIANHRERIATVRNDLHKCVGGVLNIFVTPNSQNCVDLSDLPRLFYVFFSVITLP